LTFLSDCDILYKSLEENDEVHQRGVAQFGRALRSGRRGRRFESCHLDHIFKKHAGFYQRAFSFISPFLKQEGNENHVCGERCF
jgi:hypothetical protein